MISREGEDTENVDQQTRTNIQNHKKYLGTYRYMYLYRATILVCIKLSIQDRMVVTLAMNREFVADQNCRPVNKLQVIPKKGFFKPDREPKIGLDLHRFDQGRVRPNLNLDSSHP